eukprot:g2308.t1
MTNSASDEIRSNEESSPLSLNKCTTLKYHSQRNATSAEQTFYIVGTAHVSRSSCEAVRDIIREVKPDGVFLELCDGRQGLLRPTVVKSEKSDVGIQEYMKLWRSGQATLFEVLYCWMLERFGSELEVAPGEEFRVAFEEAKQLSALVMLGDRPVNITVKRMWGSLSLWQKIRLCFMLVFTGVYIPDKEDMLKLFNEWEDTDAMTEAIRELSKCFPTLAVNLIDERDLYMVHTMRDLASKATTIVAVVGAGHLPGIKANWEEEIDIEAISSVLPRKSSSIWKYILLASSGMLIVSVGYLKFRSRDGR